MITSQRALLGIGTGAIAVALLGAASLGHFDSDNSFHDNRPRHHQVVPMGHSWSMGQMEQSSPTRMGSMAMHGMHASSGETVTSAPPFEEAETITIVADDFEFISDDITVETSHVNLTLINEGAAVHDLSIPELGIRLLASPGERVTAGLTFDTPGTYDILCSIPGHVDLGMVGSLTVLPPT